MNPQRGFGGFRGFASMPRSGTHARAGARARAWGVGGAPNKPTKPTKPMEGRALRPSSSVKRARQGAVRDVERRKPGRTLGRLSGTIGTREAGSALVDRPRSVSNQVARVAVDGVAAHVQPRHGSCRPGARGCGRRRGGSHGS